MAIDLLRIAAEHGLLLAGLAAGDGAERPGWRLVCQRCRAWLALPARPPEPVWWLRRVYAFAVRHRHPPRRGPAGRPPGGAGGPARGPGAGVAHVAGRSAGGPRRAAR